MNSVIRFCKTAASLRIVHTISVGAVAVVAQTAVFETLGIFLHLVSPSTAVIIGAEAGVLTNFYLNNRFSFRDRHHDISLFSRFFRFHLVVSGSVILQWLFVFIAEHQTSSYLILHGAYLAGLILGFVWNYTFYLLFVWKQPESRNAIFPAMTHTAQTSSFWNTVCQDAAVAGGHIYERESLLSRLLQVRQLMRRRQGFACVFWLRVNQLFIRKGWRGHFRIRIWRQYRFANDISPYANIGPGLLLPHPTDVTIGSTVLIGRNATIYNGVTLGSKRIGGDADMPCLGDNVVVYTGAKLIGPMNIGDNSEIGALALCTRDVPPNSIMYGIPPNVTIKLKK